MKNEAEKIAFARHLKGFSAVLADRISCNGAWTVKGFIDIFRNIYTISSDTKIVSKILELHLFPHFISFADTIGYEIELAKHQNYYPDLTFFSKTNPAIKFAVDIKTTYRDEDYPGFCNGFTLGSHGQYFTERTSNKNIQYPYGEYSGHFCLGIIYSKAELHQETRTYTMNELEEIPSVLHDFLFFAEEKWKFASDKSGSGNTANIGSIQFIEDILSGNGVFANASEDLFDEYWMNYGKINRTVDGKPQAITSFSEYLVFTNRPTDLNNTRVSKKKKK